MKTSTQLNHFNLLVLVTISVLYSISLLNAQTYPITNFSDTTYFWVVNNTRKTAAPSDQVYGYISGNEYRLTGLPQWQSVAMWYNGGSITGAGNEHKIDLSKDFIFDFKLYFGNDRRNNTAESGEGICFVLHNMDMTIDSIRNSIGSNGFFLGYGVCSGNNNGNTFAIDTTYGDTANITIPNGTLPSFAIEFDTHWANFFNGNEGRELFDNNNYYSSATPHIAYLQGDRMHAMVGTAPNGNRENAMVSIAGNSWYGWHCVRVHWKRTNGVDSSDGYDLTTYLDYETIARDGTFVFDGKHYNSISDLIPTLSEYEPYVSWGIVANNGENPTEKEISFIALRNDSLSIAKDSTFTNLFNQFLNQKK
jgi:hypothetical protein